MILINDVDIANYGVNVLEIRKNILPSLDPKTVVIPTRGVKFLNHNEILSNSATIRCLIKGTSINEVRNKIKDFMVFLAPFNTEKKIKFHDELGYRWGVVSVGDEETKNYSSSEKAILFDLTFDFYDPYIYGTELTTSFDTIPGNYYTVNNNGFETGFILEVKPLSTFTAVNPEIIINGKSMKYMGNLVTGDVLEINTKELTIKKNGVSVLPSFEGDFIQLQAGINTIRVEEDNLNGLHLTFKYQERWL